MAKEKPKTEQKEKQKEAKNLASAISTRGRVFEGFVVKKFPTRVVLEFERTVFVPKYNSYYKKKTKLHAKIPQGIEVEIGDYIKVQECRPISKIIHFLFIEVVRKASEFKNNKSLSGEELKK